MTHYQYYTAPPQAVFDEIKAAAIEIWKTYDDTYGYATDKINAIKDIQNVKDNAWYMVAMFDHINRAKLLSKVGLGTRMLIVDAMDT